VAWKPGDGSEDHALSVTGPGSQGVGPAMQSKKKKVDGNERFIVTGHLAF